MKIGIGNDHSALELKAEIIELLKEKGHEVVDYGTNSPESCDYPVYGEKWDVQLHQEKLKEES